MAVSESVTITTRLDLAGLSKRLEQILHLTGDLAPFMRDAAEYMLRSSKHRIRQGRTTPSGDPMPGLAELTVLLKGGNSQPLFDTGALYRGTHVEEVDASGFIIVAEASNKKGKDYAGYVQHGVEKPRGTVKTPDGRFVSPRNPIPARPFLGFSDENVRRLGRMLQDHLKAGLK